MQQPKILMMFAQMTTMTPERSRTLVLAVLSYLALCSVAISGGLNTIISQTSTPKPADAMTAKLQNIKSAQRT